MINLFKKHRPTNKEILSQFDEVMIQQQYLEIELDKVEQKILKTQKRIMSYI
jgi:hypothetical protein